MSKDIEARSEVMTPGGPATVIGVEKTTDKGVVMFRVAFSNHGGEGIYADDVVMPKAAPEKLPKEPKHLVAPPSHTRRELHTSQTTN